MTRKDLITLTAKDLEEYNRRAFYEGFYAGTTKDGWTPRTNKAWISSNTYKSLMTKNSVKS